MPSGLVAYLFPAVKLLVPVLLTVNEVVLTLLLTYWLTLVLESQKLIRLDDQTLDLSPKAIKTNVLTLGWKLVILLLMFDSLKYFYSWSTGYSLTLLFNFVVFMVPVTLLSLEFSNLAIYFNVTTSKFSYQSLYYVFRWLMTALFVGLYHSWLVTYFNLSVMTKFILLIAMVHNLENFNNCSLELLLVIVGLILLFVFAKYVHNKIGIA